MGQIISSPNRLKHSDRPRAAPRPAREETAERRGSAALALSRHHVDDGGQGMAPQTPPPFPPPPVPLPCRRRRAKLTVAQRSRRLRPRRGHPDASADGSLADGPRPRPPGRRADGPDAEEQGHVLPPWPAQGQAGQAEARAADAGRRRRRRLRRGQDGRRQHRLHRLPVGGQEHPDEPVDGPEFRGGRLRVHHVDERPGAGRLQRQVLGARGPGGRLSADGGRARQVRRFRSSTCPASSRAPRMGGGEAARLLPSPRRAISSSSCWTSTSR